VRAVADTNVYISALSFGELTLVHARHLVTGDQNKKGLRE